MKKIILAFLALLAIAACAKEQQTAPPEPSEAAEPAAGIAGPPPLPPVPPTAEPTQAAPQTSQPSQQASQPDKEFTMTARQFEFDPATIEVSKGDRVRLKITSQDVTHGFALPEFGIDGELLQPKQETTIEFTADKTGTFDFFCSNPCGSGHGGMNGKLIVK